MSKFIFSIIILTHNSELGISDSIDSIINQTLNFNKNVEIIIVDNNSNDKTREICENYCSRYPDNIRFFKLSATDTATLKNFAISQSCGEFITFLQTHDTYSKNTFKNLSKFLNKNKHVDLIALPLLYFKNNRNEKYLNYKFKKTRVINLLKQPKFIQLLGLSTFVKRDSIKEIAFVDTSNNDLTFFIEILINNPYLGICKSGTYYSKNIDEKIYPEKNLQLTSEDYKKFIDLNFRKVMERSLDKFSEVQLFIQYALMNHLRWILSIEKTLEKIDLKLLTKELQFIEDDVLLNNCLLKEEKLFAFLVKYNFDIDENMTEILGLNTIFIDSYNIINDKLTILASTHNIHPRTIDIFLNDKKIDSEEIRFPQNDKFSLNYNYAKNYSIKTIIPISNNKEFKIEFKQSDKKLHIDFSRPCNFSKTVGYSKTKNYLSILNNDSIILQKKTSLKWIKEEIKSLIHIIKEHEPGFEKNIPFRIAYMVGYPFLKNKRIWFYMDRPDESDDNGLALYKYSLDKDPDIKKYFILSSKSKEYEDIKSWGNIIPYKSLKHRYLGMFVENIITSHPDNEIIYPFWGGYPFLAGLLRSNTHFLQHGILKDDISSWLNRSKMDISLFLVSSIEEYESIFRFPYNYDREVVQLLGLPRYDTLENKKNKKQILIMPSWRRYLDHKSKEYIKEHGFFKILNSLINNAKLIEKSKEYGYEIIFRPHPKVYEFIDLFDENDYVKIDHSKVKYQTLFNNGSLMVTDYSSVAFDFAYLYKPVLYYHYSYDYHFELKDSYFDYEGMGFGEVVKTEEELVNLIIEYMENECKIKDKYYKRVNEFFLYTDKNNCKRAYDKIKEIPLKD